MSIDYLKTYRRLLNIAEAGIFYGNDVFDQERYQELKEIALQLLRHIGDEPVEPFDEIVDITEGYPTPKVDVRALIEKDGKFLLVEDAKTKEWSLPGGYAEVGCTPKENVAKEVEEETGLRVVDSTLKAIYDTDLRKDVSQVFQYYKLIFKCEVVDGEFVQNPEVTSYDYFSIDRLPKLSRKRTTKEQLVQLYESNELYVE